MEVSTGAPLSSFSHLFFGGGRGQWQGWQHSWPIKSNDQVVNLRRCDIFWGIVPSTACCVGWQGTQIPTVLGDLVLVHIHSPISPASKAPKFTHFWWGHNYHQKWQDRILNLVGGFFTNPSEKYATVKVGIISPRGDKLPAPRWICPAWNLPLTHRWHPSVLTRSEQSSVQDLLWPSEAFRWSDSHGVCVWNIYMYMAHLHISYYL